MNKDKIIEGNSEVGYTVIGKQLDGNAGITIYKGNDAFIETLKRKYRTVGFIKATHRSKKINKMLAEYKDYLDTLRSEGVEDE